MKIRLHREQPFDLWLVPKSKNYQKIDHLCDNAKNKSVMQEILTTICLNLGLKFEQNIYF